MADNDMTLNTVIDVLAERLAARMGLGLAQNGGGRSEAETVQRGGSGGLLGAKQRSCGAHDRGRQVGRGPC
jgi:hypothetical protein